jgi:GAF domain-containing protein
MAVPLLHGERTLGVLEVLDRPESSKFTLAESDLLGLFANQAALALDLLLAARRARTVLEEGAGEDAVVARLAAALSHLEEEKRDAGLRLLEALTETLERK